MFTPLAVIAALQVASSATPAPTPTPTADVAVVETLSHSLSTRGARMLISDSEDEAFSRRSQPSTRCFSAGEVSSSKERLCLFDCEGRVEALPVSNGRSCPVTHVSTR